MSIPPTQSEARGSEDFQFQYIIIFQSWQSLEPFNLKMLMKINNEVLLY